MKRIVICCDGTWNSPDKDVEGIPIATNVVKLADAVLPRDRKRIEQLVYYDTGVGTRGSWLKQLYEGATGSGLSRNVLEAYQYLIRNYLPGDELFLMGFSRGAYTVRSLAGLIRNCGILRANALQMVHEAYAIYRSRGPGSHPREKEATLFRRSYAVSDKTAIKFIGVWDTVGALGNPLLLNGILSRRYKFHDTDLSSIVSNAYQALAIDEKRRHFAPALWNKRPDTEHQTLEQVWFAGVHSNIGGGYPSAGLSDLALAWMCDKAKASGLAIGAVSLRPDTHEIPEESRKGFYLLIPRLFRPINIPDPEKGPTFEMLHPSVVEKYQRDPSYRPRNLVDYFRRFPDQLPRHP
jgi:uncharacterized protein (DUF2235 family)